MKRIMATALLLAMLLCGCGSESVYVPTGNGLYQEEATQPTTRPVQTQPKDLTLAYYPEKTLNPYEATEIAHKMLFSLVYQGLFTVDSQYQASPMLCKYYSVSRDYKTYVFYPEEATFPDGAPVTAQDIAASLEAAKAGQVYSGRLKEVSSISVTEDGGVKVVMKVAYENLPLILDIPVVKASEVAAEHPMGTGPYYYDVGLTGLQLRRNNNWWCKVMLPITAQNISLLEVDSPSTMRDDFEYNHISIVCADPGSDTYVDYRCDYELWDVESGIFLYLACNQNKAIFSNKALRAALTHAIDRDALVNGFYRGFAVSTYLPASPDSPLYNSEMASRYGYDPEKFTQVLEAAGLETLAITLLVNKADSRRVKVARSVANMLEAYGFTVTMSELSGDKYVNALKTGDYDLHLGQTKLSANMDLTAFFDPKGTMSYGGLADTANYILAQGALENEGNYPHLYQRIMDNGVICPLLFRTYAIYVQRGVLEELDPARDHIFYYDLGRTLESAKIESPEL